VDSAASRARVAAHPDRGPGDRRTRLGSGPQRRRAHAARDASEHGAAGSRVEKATVLTDPGGRQALVTSLFVFSTGAGPGEAGPLIYYNEF
jgi:hypothetical protein